MKPIREIEEDLGDKTESSLGFRPTSKFKRRPIGILIYALCGILALISLVASGVI